MNKFILMLAALLAAGAAISAAPAPSADRFLVQVAAVIAATSDEAEPVSIDDVAATAPEDKEPEAR
jgi:hypothetical protein